MLDKFASTESLFMVISSVLLLDLKIYTIITRSNYMRLKVMLCTDVCPLMVTRLEFCYSLNLALPQLLAHKNSFSHPPHPTYTQVHVCACDSNLICFLLLSTHSDATVLYLSRPQMRLNAVEWSHRTWLEPDPFTQEITVQRLMFENNSQEENTD